MEKNLIHINDGITINVNVSVKNIMYVKKVIFEIHLDLIAKMENILDDSAIGCDKIIESSMKKQILMKGNNL